MGQRSNLVLAIIISIIYLGVDSSPTKKSNEDICPIQDGIIAGQMDDKKMEEASGLAYSKR